MVLLQIILSIAWLLPMSSGVLTVHSQPGAEVLWEGASLGHTDKEGILIVSDIPPGNFTLFVRKEGYEPASRVIEVSNGNQEVRLTLRRARPVNAQPGGIPKPPVEPLKSSPDRTRPSNQRSSPNTSASQPKAAAEPPAAIPSQATSSPPSEKTETKASGQLPSNSPPAGSGGGTGEPTRGEQRSSQLARTPENDGGPFVWYVLLGLLMLWVFFLLSRKQPVEGAYDDFELPSRPGRDASAPIVPKTRPSLRDLLSRREAMLSVNEESQPLKDWEPVIDLDPDSIRKVDD